MAEAKQREDQWDAARAESLGPWGNMAHGHGYQSGGPVGKMRADLVRRLSWQEPSYTAARAGERVVRRLSVVGGYLVLLFGYACSTYLVLR